MSDGLRVLMVSDVSPFYPAGGGERMLWEQARRLAARGHDVRVVSRADPGDDAPRPPKIDSGDEDNIGGPGTPVSLTFLAGHYQDAKLAAFARAYQEATGFHKLHPKLD